MILRDKERRKRERERDGVRLTVGSGRVQRGLPHEIRGKCRLDGGERHSEVLGDVRRRCCSDERLKSSCERDGEVLREQCSE